MNGIKGFSIVVFLFLCISMFFLSIGRSEESIEDKSFREEYEKTMIGEMDFPVMIMSRIDFTNDDPSMFEELESSYIMADLHKKRFLMFFCYNELSVEAVKIEKIIVNDKYSLDFIQSSEGVDENESFVVFSLDPILTDKKEKLVITVFFEKDNKMNFEKREFIIYGSSIKMAFEGIGDFYKSHYESASEI